MPFFVRNLQISILSNLSVHTIMYYYFAMTAVGRDVWWKRHLTMLQILQFLVDLGFGYSGMYVHWASGWSCQGMRKKIHAFI